MGLAKAIIMGRITHDLEVRQTPSGVAVLQFTVAVDRNYSKDREKQTDFINCVAWRSTAEHVGKWFSKGRMIAIDGHLQTRTYEDKNGTKHYITEIMVDNVYFTGEKVDSGNYQNNGFNRQNGGGFVNQYQQAQQIQQTPQQTNGGFNGDAQTVGDLSEFEDVLTDDGSVPF
ncbi:MAG: single-stranded DNA-binding protein [Neisseriaceae bacterium]|nr:single-stranded DNA-binding protein [Neisseriaceae bacterium]